MDDVSLRHVNRSAYWIARLTEKLKLGGKSICIYTLSSDNITAGSSKHFPPQLVAVNTSKHRREKVWSARCSLPAAVCVWVYEVWSNDSSQESLSVGCGRVFSAVKRFAFQAWCNIVETFLWINNCYAFRFISVVKWFIGFQFALVPFYVLIKKPIIAVIEGSYKTK